VERLPQSDDDPDTLALTDTQNISDINDIELQMAIAESLSKK
jgi:hypothetical protein